MSTTLIEHIISYAMMLVENQHKSNHHGYVAYSKPCFVEKLRTMPLWVDDIKELHYNDCSFYTHEMIELRINHLLKDLDHILFAVAGVLEFLPAEKWEGDEEDLREQLFAVMENINVEDGTTMGRLQRSELSDYPISLYIGIAYSALLNDPEWLNFDEKDCVFGRVNRAWPAIPLSLIHI